MKPVRLKLILTFFIALFGFSAAFSQGIIWNKDRPLQWSDFKGKANNDVKLDAWVCAGEYYRSTWQTENGQRVLKFETTSVFLPDSSWAKEGAHTDRMLRHAQRRFDISEFFARQMRTALNAYKYTDDYMNEVTQVYTVLAQERNAMLTTYEDQTNHSDDYKYQKKWDVYIADLLNSNYTLEEALAKEPKKVVY